MERIASLKIELAETINISNSVRARNAGVLEYDAEHLSDGSALVIVFILSIIVLLAVVMNG
jgi:hypothetical protein